MKSTQVVEGVVFGRKVSVELEVLGECPECAKAGRKGFIYATEKGWGCTQFKSAGCKLAIFRESWGKILTEDVVEELLTQSHTRLFEDLCTKEGRRYAGRLTLQDGRVVRYQQPASA